MLVQTGSFLCYHASMNLKTSLFVHLFIAGATAGLKIALPSIPFEYVPLVQGLAQAGISAVAQHYNTDGTSQKTAYQPQEKLNFNQ